MEYVLTIGSKTMEEVDYQANYFDAIAFSHTHFRKSKRRIFSSKLSAYHKKTGGILILVNALVKKAP